MCQKVAEHEASYYVWRIGFHNHSHPQLRKTEIFRRQRLEDGSVGALVSPIMLTYTYSGPIPEAIQYKPHGNSKTQLPFQPATHQLLNRIEEEVVSNPKDRPGLLYYQVLLYFPYSLFFDIC